MEESVGGIHSVLKRCLFSFKILWEKFCTKFSALSVLLAESQCVSCDKSFDDTHVLRKLQYVPSKDLSQKT